jgi:hypothetical protein
VRVAARPRLVDDGWLRRHGVVPKTLGLVRHVHSASFEEAVFRRLRSMTRPRHNWTVIYVLAIAYILVLGPLNHFVGWRTRGSRPALLVFFGSVGVFGFLFDSVGRRGYGERAALHAVAHARVLDDRTVDVTQWNVAFVTRGGLYTFTAPGRQNFYSTCQEYEAVEGVIRNGKGGGLQVDMARFSHRAFLYRGTMRAPDTSVRVERWSGERGPKDLVLATGPHFPQPVLGAWVLHGDRVYTMRYEGGRLRVVGGAQSWDQIEQAAGSRLARGDHGTHDGPPPVDTLGRSLAEPLLAWSRGRQPHARYRVRAPDPPAGEVRLYVLAPLPESLQNRVQDIGTAKGCVLYERVVRRNADAGGSQP